MKEIKITGLLAPTEIAGYLPDLRKQGTGDTANAVFTPLSEIPLNVFANFPWGEVIFHRITTFQPTEGWEDFQEVDNG